MNIGEFIAVTVIWHIIGFLILAMISALSNVDVLDSAEGFEFVNPCFIYKYSYVNWFGTILLTIFYSFMMPIGTVCYWLYKLCTVGRNE